MRFKIQMVIEANDEQITIEDIISFDKGFNNVVDIGLSLSESKQLLKNVQQNLIQAQAQLFIKMNCQCTACQKHLRIKGTHSIQYRTLFGIVVIDSPRLHHCHCKKEQVGTFSLLNQWFSEHVSPELKYIETKWGSLIPYGLTASLLKEVLPVSQTLNASTVKNHLQNIAKRMEKDLAEKPDIEIGCGNDWAKLPKPDKPLTVGIDGGYVRNWNKKKSNFEVITGKSFSKIKSAKRFGFVQKYDPNPRHRLMDVLQKQGMQANQQIEFLSDGAENLKNLQYLMYPEASHTLDWFHITMRITVLNQFAKGLCKTDPEHGKTIIKNLESSKWYLWHGNSREALEKLDESYSLLDYEDIKYDNLKKFIKHLGEMWTCIDNNQHIIPNYGEKYRYGETITTAFVESTVNEVIAKRMVKKQQMQWTRQGAHYMIQTRTAVLNGELASYFEQWYPGFKIDEEQQIPREEVRMAA